MCCICKKNTGLISDECYSIIVELGLEPELTMPEKMLLDGHLQINGQNLGGFFSPMPFDFKGIRYWILSYTWDVINDKTIILAGNEKFNEIYHKISKYRMGIEPKDPERQK